MLVACLRSSWNKTRKEGLSLAGSVESGEQGVAIRS